LSMVPELGLREQPYHLEDRARKPPNRAISDLCEEGIVLSFAILPKHGRRGDARRADFSCFEPAWGVFSRLGPAGASTPGPAGGAEPCADEDVGAPRVPVPRGRS
jgi:hypothetical protein